MVRVLSPTQGIVAAAVLLLPSLAMACGAGEIPDGEMYLLVGMGPLVVLWVGYAVWARKTSPSKALLLGAGATVAVLSLGWFGLVMGTPCAFCVPDPNYVPPTPPAMLGPG